MPNSFEVFKGSLHYQGRRGTGIVYRRAGAPRVSVFEEDFVVFRGNVIASLGFILGFTPADGGGRHCGMLTKNITHGNSTKWLKRCLKRGESLANKKILLLMKEKKEPGDLSEPEYYKVAIHDLLTNKILLRTVIKSNYPEIQRKYIETRKTRWVLQGRRSTERLTTLFADKKFWEVLAYRIC